MAATGHNSLKDDLVEGRSALLNADAVTMLGTLLRDGPEDVQSKAIHALVALCQDKSKYNVRVFPWNT
jgi:hypothetical protein